MSLYILPDELLLIVFSYCDTNDLIRLNGICKRFYRIISEFLDKRSNHLLVTSEMSEKFRQRCHTLLSSYVSKFSTYYNWKNRIYETRPLIRESCCADGIISYFNSQLLLQMTKDTIWLNTGKSSFLCALNRTNGPVSFYNNCNVTQMCLPRIRDIIPCNDVIITNHFGGSIRQWTIKLRNGRKCFDQKVLKKPNTYANRFILLEPSFIHTNYVMDVTPRHIILGSIDGEVKIWKYLREESVLTEENVISNLNPNPNPVLYPYLNSIAFDPTGTKFAANFSGCHSVNCTIYDINKHYPEMDKKFDMYYCNQLIWENPNTILLKGWIDIKKVDVRTQNVVHTWESPSNFNVPYDICCSRKGFTCVSSDNQNAIMTGTINGQVILWDQRQNAFVQIYDVPNDENSNYWVNRVQSLQFDNSYMYILTDKFYELNFTHTAQNIRHTL